MANRLLIILRINKTNVININRNKFSHIQDQELTYQEIQIYFNFFTVIAG